MKLLRTEVELEAARCEAEEGRSTLASLDRAEKACRQGLSIKGDEPRFRTLLAQIAVQRRSGPVRNQ
jgi:hypothetical protein